jgi:5-deoxy-D-glucuronate isomerase
LPSNQAGELVAFTREQAEWEWMSSVVTRLLPGQMLALRAGDEEIALVLLGGRCIAN